MKVPLIDLKAQYQTIGEQIREAIEQVLESQSFVLGSSVEKFENEAAGYLQSTYAIGVASGTDALLLSLMALGIGPGHGVLVSPLTFVSSASGIARLGGIPIFVDVDPASCLIDPRAVETVLEQAKPVDDGTVFLDHKSGCRITAVLPVHLFGQSCAMASLIPIAQRYRLRIVEDVAQAMGAMTTLSTGVSKRAGTVGDLGCFSFFPTKNLGGAGDGGLVTTNQTECAQKIRALRVHGATSRYDHAVLGINSRLDAIQAAVLSIKLGYLNHWCEARIERARLYHRLFSSTGLIGNELIALPSPAIDNSHVFNYYVIRARRRDALKDYLRRHQIESEIYYPIPLHLQSCFAYLGYRKGDFPHAEKIASEALAIPIYPEISPEQQEMVVRKIRDFYSS